MKTIKKVFSLLFALIISLIGLSITNANAATTNANAATYYYEEVSYPPYKIQCRYYYLESGKEICCDATCTMQTSKLEIDDDRAITFPDFPAKVKSESGRIYPVKHLCIYVDTKNIRKFLIPSNITHLSIYGSGDGPRAFNDYSNYTECIIQNSATDFDTLYYYNIRENEEGKRVCNCNWMAFDKESAGIYLFNYKQTDELNDVPYKNLRIICSPGSYAEEYAVKHGIPVRYTKYDYEYSMYERNGGREVKITKYKGNDEDTAIPMRLGSDDRDIYGLPVTSIGEGAFSNCKLLKTVIIPDTIVFIENNAFKNCSELLEVKFGRDVHVNSVTSIGEGAFANCGNLEKIKIPSSVTRIGRYAFAGCDQLTEIIIPHNTTSIGEGAFHGCSELTDITIWSDKIKINKDAFSDCTNLKNITLKSINSNQLESDLYYACANTPWRLDHPLLIVNNVLKKCDNRITKVTIPNDVTSIDSKAFVGSNQKNVIIPNSVTSIDYGAFTDKKSITIYGESESYAEKFAKTYGIEFVSINDIIMGDVNLDEEVTAADIAPLQQYLLTETDLSSKAAFQADLNYDGKLNAIDLTLLKQLIGN